MANSGTASNLQYESFAGRLRSKRRPSLTLDSANNQQLTLKDFYELVQGLNTDKASQNLMRNFQIQELPNDTLVQAIMKSRANKEIQKEKKNWSGEDKKLLIWIVIKLSILDCFGLDAIPETTWRKVSGLLECYTAQDCQRRWLQSLNVNLCEFPFTDAEDKVIIEEVKQSDGAVKWTSIANKLNGSNNNFSRTGKQCRERWNNHLSPDVRKSKWTVEEELELVEFVIASGKRWAHIARSMKSSRNENQVKNHFYSLIKKAKNNIDGLVHTLRESIPPKLEKFRLEVFDSLQDGEMVSQCLYNPLTQTLYQVNKHQMLEFINKQQLEQMSSYSHLNMPFDSCVQYKNTPYM